MINKKKFLYVGILATFLIVGYLFYNSNFFYLKNQKINCECSNHNGKYGPKGEKCFEQMEQNIGAMGYYGELKYEKKTYYYLLKCK